MTLSIVLRAPRPDLNLELRPAGSVELRAQSSQGRVDCACAYASEDGSDAGFARPRMRAGTVIAALPAPRG
jgi:hypothetical protein